MNKNNNFYFLKLNNKIKSIKLDKNIPLSKYPESWKKIYFKSYVRFPKLYLDKNVIKDNSFPLLTSILKRRSYNSDNDKVHNLEKKELSTIFLSGSIINQYKDIYYNSTRAYPSGGARYPLEQYIIIFNSKTIKKGLYHYNVKLHALEYMWNITKKDVSQSFKQDFVTECSGIIIITSVINRSAIKYGERAYTFSHIEAGHLGQNIVLLSESIDLKCRPIGLFDNKKLMSILDLHTNKEIILYNIAIA